MNLSADKCQFRLPKLTFFGHEVSKQRVAPSEEKIVAVVNARAPKNISGVLSFVQLLQYSAKFIPNFFQEEEPLRKLLRKGHAFVGGITQQTASERLTQLKSSSKALVYFQSQCKTRIVADASPDDLGRSAPRNLGRESNRDGMPRQRERQWLLFKAYKRFNLYVYGREFELETDHKPLQCIFGKSSKPSARIKRYVDPPITIP